MIKISVTAKVTCNVNIDVESFSEIRDDVMSIEESDKLIKNAFYKQYGIFPSMIQNVR